MFDRNPIAIIISRLGGQTAAAKMLNMAQSTVAGWVAARRIPSHRIPDVIVAARKLDPPVSLRPDDFFEILEDA